MAPSRLSLALLRARLSALEKLATEVHRAAYEGTAADVREAAQLLALQAYRIRADLEEPGYEDTAK